MESPIMGAKQNFEGALSLRKELRWSLQAQHNLDLQKFFCKNLM